MITGVDRVLIEVEDQDRAKEFWTTKAGFELEFDETFGGERWIEVRPPSGTPIVVLIPRPDGKERPELDGVMPTSNVFFTSDDIEAAYETLTERGVTFPVPPSEQHFGWWSVFEDSEGNRHALAATSRDRS